MYTAKLNGGLGDVPPESLIKIQENMAPSRAWVQYYYKRVFKPLFMDSVLSQGGHPIASLIVVRILGAPLESQYRYPEAYYRGFKKTTKNGYTYYQCSPPHVTDDVLSDVFQKYAKPPPGGVVALAKVYNFEKFVPKLLHNDQSKSLFTIACAFSVPNACTQAYGTPSLVEWKAFSQPFVRRLRHVLSEGFGIAIGIPVFASWSLTGYPYKLPFPVPTNDAVTGYHAMSAVSFTVTSSNCTDRSDLNVYWDTDSGSLKDAGCLILRNSWGDDAGKCRACVKCCLLDDRCR